MPWAPAKFIEIDEKVSPSFFANNLSGDGEGRFAFAHGHRVQCTRRRFTKNGRNDFTLGLRSSSADILQVYFWENVPNYARPLLVLVTDTPREHGGNATLQIWDTKSGKGNRVFCVNLEARDGARVRFGRGLSSSQGANGASTLFVGLSTGELRGFQIKRGYLELVCALKGLPTAICCVAGDKKPSSYISASDEMGNVLVWHCVGSNWHPVYNFKTDDDDYCPSLGIRGRLLIAGHASGKVTFHDLQVCRKMAETMTNTKSITGIDVHPSQGIILATGEDCRATILTLPTTRGEELHVVLSVCLNSVIIGGCFTCARPGMPDITLIMWERTHLIQYEFVD